MSFPPTVLSPFTTAFGVTPARPPDSDPLRILTWYLESKSTTNCFISTPLAQFEIHQYEFVPFRDKSSAQSASSAPNNNNTRAKYSVVSLSMVNCVLRAGQQQSTDADFELRLTVIRHVLKEMIRLQKGDALVIYRLNNELAPCMNAIYQQSLPQELAKLQPNVRHISVEPKHNSLQIVLARP